MERIRVLIVDDHEIVRLGLRTLFNRVSDFEVVGEVGTVRETEERVVQHNPDVVIMDIRLPDGSGIDACRNIRATYPETQVIMLTSYSDDEAVFGAVMAGASGYVLKTIGGNELIDGVRRVARGESLLDPSITGKVLERVRTGVIDAKNGRERLTEQEERILAQIAEGKTNKEIAAKLYLSEKTVRNYVSNILGKLDVANRAEAAAYAVRRGIKS